MSLFERETMKQIKPNGLFLYFEWRHQMKHINRWLLVTFIFAGLLLSACGPKEATTEKISPSKLEPIEGTAQQGDLTEKAAERIGEMLPKAD
jgi:hypothetical protein